MSLLARAARTWWYEIFLAAITLAHLLMAAWLAPCEDELYYWAWSQHLQASYYDHPPMVAYSIRASTAFLGDTLFAVRLPAVLASLGTILILGRLMRRRSLLVLMMLSPIYLLGAILQTPDAPLVFFWSAYALWLCTTLKRLDGDAVEAPQVRWVVGGVLLGLGVLSKYTMALAVPCSLLAFMGCRRLDWWRGYLRHLSVAFVVALPILIYNVQQDFAPLRFQGGHTAAGGISLPRFIGFLGGQAALTGTLPLLMLPVILWRTRSLWAQPTTRACYCLFVLPVGFFLFHALTHNSEANWPVVGYITFWPIACALLEREGARSWTLRLCGSSFLIPMTCSLLLCLHLVHPIGLLVPEKDRIHRLAAKCEMARQVAQCVQKLPDRPVVYAANYQTTATLRFHSVEAHQLPGVSRASFFTVGSTPKVPKDFVLFSEYPPCVLVPGCTQLEVLDEFPLMVRGQELRRFRLTRCLAPDGADSLTEGKQVVGTLAKWTRP